MLLDKFRWTFFFPRCLGMMLVLSIKLIPEIFFSMTLTLCTVTAFLGSSRRFTGEDMMTWHSRSCDINCCSLNKSSAIFLAWENVASLFPTCAIMQVGCLHKQGTMYYISSMIAPGNDPTFLFGPILDSSIPPSILSPTTSVVPALQFGVILFCSIWYGGFRWFFLVFQLLVLLCSSTLLIIDYRSFVWAQPVQMIFYCNI